MERFRSNLVVGGDNLKPYVEDEWQELRLRDRDIRLDVSKMLDIHVVKLVCVCLVAISKACLLLLCSGAQWLQEAPASTPSGAPELLLQPPAGFQSSCFNPQRGSRAPASTPSGVPELLLQPPAGLQSSCFNPQRGSRAPASTPSGVPELLLQPPAGLLLQPPAGFQSSCFNPQRGSRAPASTPSGAPESTPSGAPASTPSGAPESTPSGVPEFLSCTTETPICVHVSNFLIFSLPCSFFR